MGVGDRPLRADDSGKTNVLEALEFLFTGEPRVRWDRFAEQDDPLPPDAEMLLELDALDVPGSGDQELFVGWVENMLPRWDAEGLDELRGLVAALPEAPDRAAAVDAVCAYYRDLVRQIVEYVLREQAGADDADAAVVAAAWARSNRFRMTVNAVEWRVPENLRAEVTTALARIGTTAPEGRDPGRLNDVGLDPEFSEGLVHVVRLDFDGGGLAELQQRIETFVDRETARREFPGWPRPLPEMVYLNRGVLAARKRADPWLERDGDAVSLHPLVLESCADLSTRATELAPPFITRDYEIVIHPHTPDEWRRLGHRASVRLRPLRAPDETFDLAVASTGIATWVGYAIAEAIRLYEEADIAHRTTLFLLGEPERHLHPVAQGEIADWITERAASGAHVVVATHAPPFLQLGLEHVEYCKVARGRTDRQTRTTRITGEIIEALSDSGADLGLSPATLIQLTRAWLVVEGEHDKKIVDAFFGHELREAWVGVIALRRAARAKATFLNLQVLKPLGIPFFVLLDNVRADLVKRGQLPEGASEEERIAADLVRLAREEGVRLKVEGLSYPDVLCTR